MSTQQPNHALQRKPDLVAALDMTYSFDGIFGTGFAKESVVDLVQCFPASCLGK